MKIYKAVILSFIFIILCIFWGYEILGAIKQHLSLFMRWYSNTKLSYYPWYLLLLVGGSIFPLMNKFFVKNMELTKTFTHELTHTITGLLLFRRIHSFHAEEQGSGVVWSSGNDSIRFMTSLAPYCFPIYTFPLLMLRCLVAQPFMPIIDTLIGFSVGLHLVCFSEQTRNYQTDINQFPLWFSYIYIQSVWLFDISLIFIAYIPKSNIFIAFRTYALDVWNMFF